MNKILRKDDGPRSMWSSIDAAPSFPGNRHQVYLTKLRYDESASIWLGDKLFATPGMCSALW
jgi:hypothetical protein